MSVVALCMPIADQLHYRTLNSIMGAFSGTPREVGLQWFGRTDAPVDVARNVLVEGILKEHPQVTHFMWVDDDMVFAPDAIAKLLARDLPIVGGLCHNRRHPYQPILMRRVDGSIGYSYVYDWPEGELVEVDATGAAFLLVKREVFEKLAATLPKEEQPFTMDKNGGEDVRFCERAKDAGFSIFVDTSVSVGHVGEVVVDDAFARRNRDCLLVPWRPKVEETAENPAEPYTSIGPEGLRVRGDEPGDEARRHRARYNWAGRQIARVLGRGTGTVLDFGCGTGYGCPIMSREALLRGAKPVIYGFDPDPEAIRFGLAHWWTALAAEESVVLAPDSTYAAIVSFECLEHLSQHPATTLGRLLGHAPAIIGSVPFMEPKGFNPHHAWHSLSETTFRQMAAHERLRFEFFGQRWDGEIGPIVDRETTPIMLFIARRA